MAMMEAKGVNTCLLPLRGGALFVAARVFCIDRRGEPVAISAWPQTLPPVLDSKRVWSVISSVRAGPAPDTADDEFVLVINKGSIVKSHLLSVNIGRILVGSAHFDLFPVTDHNLRSYVLRDCSTVRRLLRW
jgi:hypothetical protein